MANKPMTRAEVKQWAKDFTEDFNKRQEALMKNCTCGYAIGHPLVPTCVCKPKEWQGLTDEEIKEIIGPWGDTPIKGYTRKLFDQIEAKLREKNA
jgi:hypothetical protein